MRGRFLEVCVDDAAGITAASAGGTHRLKLCAALGQGGLMLWVGLMRLAAATGLPVMAMIRPRVGDFMWSKAEIDAQKVEIAAARGTDMARSRHSPKLASDRRVTASWMNAVQVIP